MRAHEAVLDWLEQQLRDGLLRPGARLPPERDLARRLGIARAGLREGLRVLEALGMLRPGVGSGPAAGTLVITEPGPAIGTALRLQLGAGAINEGHLEAMRVLLEQRAAHGAVRAEAARLAELEPLLEAMNDRRLGPDGFLDLDDEFHRRLAASGGDPLIEALLIATQTATRRSRRRRAEALPDWSASAARLRAEHGAILAAARARLPERTARLLGEHLAGEAATTERAEWSPLRET